MKLTIPINIKLPGKRDFINWWSFFIGLPKWLRVLLVFLIILPVVLYFICSSLSGKLEKMESVASKQAKEIDSLHSELLNVRGENIALAKEIDPFKEEAKKKYADLDPGDAMVALLKDFRISEKLNEQYDFTPLSKPVSDSALGQIKVVAPEFIAKDITIEITYETWVSSSVKQFAEELANLLTAAGLVVKGPGLAVVYVEKQPSRPFEWEYNILDERSAEKLRDALKPLIDAGTKYSRRYSGLSSRIKVHFAGQIKFSPEGVATIY